ncbi:unnamed protein product [Prunus armeniaca]
MAKHSRMILYLDKVQGLLKAFPTFTIQRVPRAENAHADALASIILRASSHLHQVPTNARGSLQNTRWLKCRNHAGGRSLAQKALSIGYFWPTMHQDSTEYARRCDRCQRYKPVPGLPAEEYHLQNSPWPFIQWAIDLVGPMPTAPANKEMIIIATDYFTKWIKAEALSSTKEADIE